MEFDFRPIEILAWIGIVTVVVLTIGAVVVIAWALANWLV